MCKCLEVLSRERGEGQPKQLECLSSWAVGGSEVGGMRLVFSFGRWATDVWRSTMGVAVGGW